MITIDEITVLNSSDLLAGLNNNRDFSGSCEELVLRTRCAVRYVNRLMPFWLFSVNVVAHAPREFLHKTK